MFESLHCQNNCMTSFWDVLKSYWKAKQEFHSSVAIDAHQFNKNTKHILNKKDIQWKSGQLIDLNNYFENSS